MRRVAVVALLAAACGSIALAQSLSLAFRTGDHYQYALHLTSKESVDAGMMTVPLQTDLNASEEASVQSVDSAGIADVLLSFSNVTLKMTTAFGQTSTTTTTTEQPLPSEDLKIAPDGRILTIDGSALMGSMQFGLGGESLLISAVLPDSAAKPGDTWSNAYDQTNPSGSGAVHIAAKSKYVRDETINGVKAAVVETKSTATLNITVNLGSSFFPGLASPLAPSPSPPASGQGQEVQVEMTVTGALTSDVTTWIDPGSHRVLKSHMSETDDITLAMTPNGPSSLIGPIGPIPAKGTLTLNLDPA